MSDSFETPWTITHQAPLSMGFPRQEYWSGLPIPSPRDLPNSGMEPESPALQVDSLPLSHLGGRNLYVIHLKYSSVSMSIPNYPFPPTFPAGNHKLVSLRKISLWVVCIISFQIPHVRDVICYFSFSVWLLSLNMIISRSIHDAANGIISFFLMAE